MASEALCDDGFTPSDARDASCDSLLTPSVTSKAFCDEGLSPSDAAQAFCAARSAKAKTATLNSLAFLIKNGAAAVGFSVLWTSKSRRAQQKIHMDGVVRKNYTAIVVPLQNPDFQQSMNVAMHGPHVTIDPASDFADGHCALTGHRLE